MFGAGVVEQSNCDHSNRLYSVSLGSRARRTPCCQSSSVVCLYLLSPRRVPHFQFGFAPAAVTIVAPTRIVLVAGVCATLEAAAILAGRAELASTEVERAPLRPHICAHLLEFVDIATAVPAVSSRAENLRAPRQPEDEVLLVCAVGAARRNARLRVALVPTGRIRPRPVGWPFRAVCAAGGEAPRSSRLHSTSKKEKQSQKTN